MIVTQALSNSLELYTELLDDYLNSLISWNDYTKSAVDPRMDNYFLMSSPLPTLLITFAYLIFVRYMLPAYMKSRPAYVLKNTIFYYNLFQVILSSVIVYLSYGSGYVRRFSLLQCRELDTSFSDPDAIMALQGVYIFYLSKFTEFLDTIFFVLRKKESQVSFLHVFHHASMPFNVWLMARVAPGGSSTMISGTNASVHVVMYTYYLLAGLGPRWQPYLWWKKYLTTMQLIQFAYGIIYIMLMIATTNKNSCPILMKRFPLIVYSLIYIAVLITLFSHFYVQTYTKENDNKSQKKEQKIK